MNDSGISSQCLELRSLIDVILESLDGTASSKSDTDSDTLDDGDLLVDIISHLRSRNRCLINLNAFLDRPAADADFVSPGTSQHPALQVSGPAETWTRKVIDNFRQYRQLTKHLGEANWQRYQRVSKELEAIVPQYSDSDATELFEDDEVPELPKLRKSKIE